MTHGHIASLVFNGGLKSGLSFSERADPLAHVKGNQKGSNHLYGTDMSRDAPYHVFFRPLLAVYRFTRCPRVASQFDHQQGLIRYPNHGARQDAPCSQLVLDVRCGTDLAFIKERECVVLRDIVSCPMTVLRSSGGSSFQSSNYVVICHHPPRGSIWTSLTQVNRGNFRGFRGMEVIYHREGSLGHK